MDVIVTEGLEKNFGAVRALRGLGLRVSDGVFGFIGVNGAGKTTTIKILVGALRPSGGTASVLGYDCVKESLNVRQKIGVLHETPAFPKNTSGLDYLTFVAQLYGSSQAEAKRQARNTLEEVGLSSSERRLIGGYSAGMRQRLGLAQALVGNPELVILDEPTANLDPIGRSEMLRKIRELHAEKGVSFFISSHILPELQSVCDHIGIIDAGVVLEQGDVQEVVEKHAGGVFKIVVSESKAFLDVIRGSKLVEEFNTAQGAIWIKTNEPQLFHDYVMKVIREKGLHLSLFQHGDLEIAFKNVVKADKND
jgi:ABC-2 type transport system ATP-binding protein